MHLERCCVKVRDEFHTLNSGTVDVVSAIILINNIYFIYDMIIISYLYYILDIYLRKYIYCIKVLYVVL
jgi:hypothetical protein